MMRKNKEMTKFSLYIYIVPLLIPFQAITMEADWRYEKVVDNDSRKVYYQQCKQDELGNCHMYSFQKSVKLRIVDANPK
jgi:hypothetical protein